MNIRPWMGFAVIVIFLSGGYLRVRRERRSGITNSFGHPTLDSLLLLTSGLLVVSGLALTFLFFKGDSHRHTGRFLFYIVALSLGGALRWLCNRILSAKGRK